MNARSLQSVLVLLAQILGPFGQTWVFYKFGWVFYKFTENREFLNRWFLLLRGKNRDACAVAVFFLWPHFLWFSFRKTKSFLMLGTLSGIFFNSFPFTPSALKTLTKRVSFVGQLIPGIPNHSPVECRKYLLKILTFYGKPPSWSCAQNISLR